MRTSTPSVPHPRSSEDGAPLAQWKRCVCEGVSFHALASCAILALPERSGPRCMAAGSLRRGIHAAVEVVRRRSVPPPEEPSPLPLSLGGRGGSKGTVHLWITAGRMPTAAAERVNSPPQVRERLPGITQLNRFRLLDRRTICARALGPVASIGSLRSVGPIVSLRSH